MPPCVRGVVVFKTGVSVCVRVFFDLVDVVVLKFSAYNLFSRMDGVGLLNRLLKNN